MTSKIGIGTVQFGTDYGISNNLGQTAPTEIGNIISFAYENNIRIIDTASAYGNAESILGNFDLSKFNVVSKFILNEENNVFDCFSESIKKLKTNSLYGFLAHRPLQLISRKDEWKKLEELKGQNKVKKIGVSINEINEINILLDNNIIPDIIQAPFNYFDNRFVKVFMDLKKLGCEVHSRSAFLQGLFFCNVENLGITFEPVKDIIENLQKEYDDKLPGFLLNYCIKQEFIDCVIFGVNNLSQLKMNIDLIGNSYNFDKKITFSEISEEIIIPSKWNK